MLLPCGMVQNSSGPWAFKWIMKYLRALTTNHLNLLKLWEKELTARSY